MKQHWRLKTTFWLDIVLLVSVCMLESVRFTGLVIHEWLGLAIVAMVLAHLLFSWSWIDTQSRRFFGKQTIRDRINYIINVVFFFAVTAAVLSGILISQKAIPALTGAKVSAKMGMHWGGLHETFSHMILIFAGFHLAINWDWLLAATGSLFRLFRESPL
jgi:Domain of unknown function (DUF4405)